jgi:hypothetical protein
MARPRLWWEDSNRTDRLLQPHTVQKDGRCSAENSNIRTWITEEARARCKLSKVTVNGNLAACFGSSIQRKPYNSPNNIRPAAQVGRDSDSLRAGWSGDQSWWGARFSTLVQPAPGLTHSTGNWVPGLFPGGKVAGEWRSQPISI